MKDEDTTHTIRMPRDTTPRDAELHEQIVHNERTLSIEDLASLGGVSRRTIRYYVQLGLLPAPDGAGRGSRYTQEHLDRLIRVRTWQEQGVSLADIESMLAGHDPASEPDSEAGQAPQLWRRYWITDGVELHVRSDAPASRALIDRMVQAMKDGLHDKRR